MVQTLTLQGMPSSFSPDTPPYHLLSLRFHLASSIPNFHIPPQYQGCPSDIPATRAGTPPRRSSERPVPRPFISLAQMVTSTSQSSYSSMVPILTEPTNMALPLRPLPGRAVTKFAPKPFTSGLNRRIKTSGTVPNIHMTVLPPRNWTAHQENTSM